MSDCVDHVARDIAQRAFTMITAHEQAAVGWRSSVNNKLDHIGENIKALYDRNWMAAVGLIMLLIGVCGYLINKHGI